MNKPLAHGEVAAKIPRIKASDGTGLRFDLFARLNNPNVEKVTFLIYQYNDFDLSQGRPDDRNSGTSVIRMLERVAQNGAEVSIVIRDISRDRVDSNLVIAWLQAINRLQKAGADVLVHPALHAKTYLFEFDDKYWYSVGSSNLTWQGMSKWSECNISGWHKSDYEEVKRRIVQIKNDIKTLSFDIWVRTMKIHGPVRTQLALQLAGF